ncbi:hypothetical protein MLD38_038414 [Melastoma candidum]|uniref:Uncharacterized protein n=1 Tax=Melastoma candidum TaxID=119954 RepID=A0ACB9KYT7_9MYRT|nr:hypothetical protein MLD38_038414 [Melastoma candidum]
MSQGNGLGDNMTMAGGDGGNGGRGGMVYTPMVKMMQMSFYWGKEATVLFCSWPGEDLGMYVLCLLFIFFLAAIQEILHLTMNGKLVAARTVWESAGQAVAHGLRMVMAYLVMLAVMSFNGGVFIAAVIGHAFGFFIVKARAAAAGNRIPANNSTAGSDKP